MARPKKEGLDYFPVDVEFDDKVESIIMIHEHYGLTWIIRFWQCAYKTMTGMVDFNGLFGELFVKKCRITLENHLNILKTAIDVNFCYETESNIYTSNGIQKRIAAVSSERSKAIKRQKRRVKEKESKVKETPSYSTNNTRINTEKRRQSFINEINEFEAYPEEMKNKFIEYWTEKNKSGTKMRFEMQKTWETSKRLATWASRSKEFNQSQHKSGADLLREREQGRKI